MNSHDVSAASSLNVPLVMVRGLTHTFHQGDEDLTVFRDLSLALGRGEIVALVGPSGAGKSTLLQMIGLLDVPTAGKIILHGRDVSNLSDEARTALRCAHIGFVYQFHHLLPEFTALENVMIPQMIAGKDKKTARAHAAALLDLMGLSARTSHRPARLSGGEQQRVAIARALANNPAILLADEPTGNLDPETSAHVFDVLLHAVRTRGTGALIATHNMDLARKMDRIIELKHGQITGPIT